MSDSSVCSAAVLWRKVQGSHGDIKRIILHGEGNLRLNGPHLATWNGSGVLRSRTAMESVRSRLSLGPGKDGDSSGAGPGKP